MERASAAFRQQGVQFPKQEVLTGSSPNMLTKPDLVKNLVSRDTIFNQCIRINMRKTLGSVGAKCSCHYIEVVWPERSMPHAID